MITDDEAAELVKLMTIVGTKPTTANKYDNAANRLVLLLDGILKRREAERVERVKPITRDWLKRIGFCNSGDDGYWRCIAGGVAVDVAVLDSINRCQIVVGDEAVETQKESCGQLLDLLAALKGGAT